MVIYNLSKFFYILFIFYVGIFQTVFFQIPHMPLILGLSMIILLIAHMGLTQKKISFVITTPVSIWLVFACYAFLSGLFIANDKVHLMDSLFTYVQTLAMVIYIINVAKIDKNNNFFIKSYLLFSIVYMIIMLFYGYHDTSGRIFLSPTSNPNGDGITLLFGIFCLLILFDKNKLWKLIRTLVLLGLFLYTIILTGSRKSFIVAVLLVVLWFIIVFRDYWKIYSTRKKIISILILLVGVFIVVRVINPIFKESTLFWKLTEKGYLISSDETRSGMYREAFMFFKSSPFFGIGFKQYERLSIYHTYSHSTYAEIISTTGIIGTIIYFSAYAVVIYNLFWLYRKRKGLLTSIIALQYLILMFAMLALGTGVILFYGITYHIMFALMVSFYYNERMKLNGSFSTN